MFTLRIIGLYYSLFMFTLIMCFTCRYSYAKIVTTKSWMLLNLCQAFWASWTPCYTCWVRHVLTLVYFYYLDKNPRWVTDGYGNDDFPEDYSTCGQPVDVPVIWSFRERFIFILPLYLCEDYVLLFVMWYILVMILFIIYRLMCVTDL